MNDPAGGVPPALVREPIISLTYLSNELQLPHIHLISNQNYPHYATLPLEKVVEYLVQAPQITREFAPMHWQFLDAPADGYSMIVWQPPQLGTHFATDGYVWAGVEQPFVQEVRGYMVEMYYYRSGYHPSHETLATHARKRYRLVPTAHPNPSTLAPDTSLWLVHYTRAESQYHIPANRIAVTAQIQTALTQRKYLHQHGQLVRKDFMLHDRNSWPNINLPNSGVPQAGWHPASTYPNNVMNQMHRSQQSYMLHQQAGSHGGVGPSPAKRQRQVGPGHAHGMTRPPVAAVLQDSSIDVEDAIHGDSLDTLTPRDISAARYKQHHEWMEEIFSSPYGTSQIIPVELGLGRKGEIESLTRDFFGTPTSNESPLGTGKTIPRVGRLSEGKAEDFMAKATQRISAIQSEMDKLRQQHAKRMSKINKGVMLKEAEHQLRSQAATKPNGEVSVGQTERLEELVEKVAESLGQTVKSVKDIECIQNGGLEEKTQANDADARGLDIDEQMNDFDAQTADPAPFQNGQDKANRDNDSAGQTPKSYQQPPEAIQSDGAQDFEQIERVPGEDITMAEGRSDVDNKDAEIGDWVLVNKDNDSNTPQAHGAPELEEVVQEASAEGHVEPSGDDFNTAGAALQDFAPEQGDNAPSEFNPTDFQDTVDFGNLDTAGEALSGFEEGNNAELGLDDHGDLGLDDTAFGDAFHASEAPVEQEKEPAEA
ncbi:MAG: hypothetical protein Q9191_000808 [Dirinaria sp. TL-2023a]